MMKHLRRLLTIAATATTFATLSAAMPLAEKLPAETVFYGEFDLGKTLTLLEAEAELMGTENAKQLVSQVKETYGQMLEVLDELSFHPQILDQVKDIDLYAFLMELDVPVTETTVVKVPRFDADGNYVPGEFDEEERTKEHPFSIALLIETQSPELAQNFIAELKQALLKQAENKDEPTAATPFLAVDVPKGEAIRVAGEADDSYFGQLDKYVIICDVAPEQVWQRLTTSDPAEKPIARTDLYKRYDRKPDASLGAAILNISSLVDFSERTLQQKLAEATDAAQSETDPRVAQARNAMMLYELCKNIFSLDKLLALGYEGDAAIVGNSAIGSTDISLLVGDGLSQTMLGFLDGGAKLQAPPYLQSEEYMVMAWRMSLPDVLQGIVTSLPPEMAGSYQMMNGMAMMQTGMTLEQMFGHFAGDFYVRMDMVMSEVQQPSYDEETDEFVTETKEMAVPQFTAYMGLADAEAAAQAMANLAARLAQQAAANEDPSPMREHKVDGITTYLLGEPEDGADPAGTVPEETVAAGILGRHLVVGKWADVKHAVQLHQQPADHPVSPFQKYFKQHPDVSMLTITPAAFTKKMQRMNVQQFESMGLEEMITESLASDFDLPIDNPELEAKLQKSLTKTVELFMNALEELQGTAPQDSVITGKLYPDAYRVESKSVMEFPEAK